MKLHHETLNTGHIAVTDRREVMDEAIVVLQPWIEELLSTDEPRPLPFPPSPCRALAEAVGDGLLLRLLDSQGQAMVTFGCGDGQRADALWRQMQRAYRGGQAKVPGAPDGPWCLVQIGPPSLELLEALPWLGDFERCVAWSRLAEPVSRH